MMRCVSLLVALLALLESFPPLIAQQAESAARWPSWRGVSGTGATTGEPPLEWSETKNIKWKVAVPGLGISTPIVWGDLLVVTAAVETDRPGEPPKLERPTRREGRRPEPRRPRGEEGEGGRREGGGRGRGNLPPPTKVFEFMVTALDRHTGKVQWSTKVKETVPHEGGHETGSQASSSPVTDGEFIYAFLGSRGLHCLDMKGNVKWSKDLGYMFTRNSFGEGASPALHGNRLVITWDHEGQSFIAAFDKRTGEQLWKTLRDEISAWSTPQIAELGDKAQVIVTATKASCAYDLETGKELWSLKGMTTNCIPTPIVDQGVAYLMSGFRGAALQAVKLVGAKGDLAESKNVLWTYDRNTSYVPSALLYDGHLYFLRSNSGVLSSVEAKTGKVVYEGKRIGLKTIYASPVGAAGRIYLTSRDGVTKVLKSGPEPTELASNELEDEIDASPVVIGSELYLRGRKHIYAISETKPAK